MSGEELKAVLLFHGISQQTLAEKLGCTQASIAIRLTRKKVRRDILQAVEDILGRPPRRIIEEPEGGIENNNPLVQSYIMQLEIKNRQIALKDEEIKCYIQQLDFFKNKISELEKINVVNRNYQEKM